MGKLSNFWKTSIFFPTNLGQKPGFFHVNSGKIRGKVFPSQKVGKLEAVSKHEQTFPKTGEPMKTFGIKDICERYGVGEHTVLEWIRRGDLRAIDVSRKQGGRPKWRVTQQAIDAFEMARTPAPPLPRAKRRKRPADVIEFYQ